MGPESLDCGSHWQGKVTWLRTVETMTVSSEAKSEETGKGCNVSAEEERE